MPGVVYGDGGEPENIALNGRELNIIIGRGKFLSTVFDLDVGGKKARVIPREVQLDPVKDWPIHVDFQRVGAGARIRVNVPVRFINEGLSPGLKRGGVLNVVRHEIEVTCPADAIPDYFEFNLEGLEIGRSVHISAIKLPEGVKPTILNRDFTVATIAGHKIEEEPDARRRGRGRRRRRARRGRGGRSRRRGRRRRQGRPRQGGAPPPRLRPARKPRGAKPAAAQACRRQGKEIGAAVGSAGPAANVAHEALRRPRQSGQRACAAAPQRRLHGAWSALPSGTGSGPGRSASTGSSARGRSAGSRVMLLKPQTYMNDSGRSVGEAQRYLKIDEGDIYVFHDELDLAPGKLKVKTGGGNAGHNGLRSITAHIGNEYARVRIGIGHPGSKELVYRYVLHDFAKADAAWLGAAARRHRRCGAAAGGRRRRPLPDRRGARAEGGRGAAQGRRSAGPSARHREPPAPRAPSGRRAPVQAHERAGREPQEVAEGPQPRELIDGLQMRHRGPAQRRQVHALQRADADGGRRGRQLSLLHHRAQRRRRRRARPAARPAGGGRQVRRRRADAPHLRRHRRPGARRLQGRGPRQPVPRPHPRGRRGGLRAALLRGRRRHPRRGPRRPASPMPRRSRPS